MRNNLTIKLEIKIYFANKINSTVFRNYFESKSEL